MNRKPQIKMQTRLAAPLILLALSAGLSQGQPAENFYLAAQQFNKTMPGGEVIPMWGFAEYDSTFTTLLSEPNIPGPLLAVPDDNNTLVIHLKNELTVPISLVIPGLPAAMDPNFFTDDQGRRRVRSFTNETHPGETRQYTWPNLRAGTYVYHSGAHPQVQVQMGLYGPATVHEDGGNVYAGYNIDNEVSLFFSEIDPALHNAVATGNYGPGKAMTSTIEFAPRYFLINGRAYRDGLPPIFVGDDGDNILLRFFSAGLQSHFPILQRLYMDVIAEDAYLYPFPRTQYSLLLAAGQTKLAVIEAIPAGLYTLYDRGLDLTNDANSPGGMRVKLQVGPIIPNIAPQVSTISAVPNVIPPGACTTQLSLTAFDPDDSPETPLVYSWKADCGVGTFNDPTISNPIYTFPENLSPGAFTFTVYISDGADTTVATVDVTIEATPGPELIVDNRDSGASSTGTWRVSSGENPWGADSVYSRTAGDTFTFQASRQGQNTVSLRWTDWPSRSPNVTVQIWDGDTQIATGTVDQTANANTWVPVGTYNFTGIAKVVIVATGDPFSTNADAARFTPAGTAFVDHIEIFGPTMVGDADAPVNYDIMVFNSDGTWSLTDPQIWNVVDAGTSIDATGTLTVPNVIDDTPAQISAEYTANGCTHTDTLDITIVDGVVAVKVVVDNRDTNTSQTGIWPVSGGVDPWGIDSVWNKTVGDTFTFHADLVGVPYAVYMRWTDWPSRRSSVPVEIRMNGLVLDTVTVNQRQNPNMWNLLGIYTLGPNSQVTITSLDSDGSTNADAVRFTPVSILTELVMDNDDPVATGAGLWFTSEGANPYGSRSVWSRGVGDTFSYMAPLTGTVNIEGWWTEWPSRSASVPVEIYDGAALLTTVNVDQTTNGGMWNTLATGLNFTNSVRIVVRSTTPANSTNADAFKIIIP